MRAIEGFLFILNIFMIVLFTAGWLDKIKVANYLPLITFILLVLHLIIEKARWQMYPLYLVTIFYFLIVILAKTSFLSIAKINLHSKIKILITGITIFLIVVSFVLVYLFPVYKMAMPVGEYKIGTQSFDLTDPERNAVYSSNLNEKRRIKIQVWYPAESVKGFKRVPWMREGKLETEALAKEMKLPSFTLDQTALVMSNSYEKAPISKKLKKYPVVVISHGWTGFKDIHADVAEELASNGYIVVGIDHTFGSQITVFNDGEVSYLNKKALPNEDTVPDFIAYASKLVDTYGGDVNLTINELEKFNNGDTTTSFKDKIDLSEIGLLGHSTGGGGDVSVALEDNRIKAIVGMDAWVEPIDKVDIDKGLKIPALFLRSGQWEVGINNKNLLRLMDKSTGLKSLYQINGTNHSDFTMVYRYSPLTKYMKLTGDLDYETASSIQRDFIHHFFDQNLKHKKAIDLNDIAKKWKEVSKIR